MDYVRVCDYGSYTYEEYYKSKDLHNGITLMITDLTDAYSLLRSW